MTKIQSTPRSTSSSSSSRASSGTSSTRRSGSTPSSTRTQSTRPAPDRSTVSREASSPRSAQQAQPVTQGLQQNYSTPASNFRAEVAQDFQTASGIADRASQGIGAVDGAAAGAQRGGTPSTSAGVNRAVEGASNGLSRVATVARVAGPIATVASGAYETAGHVIDPNQTAGQRTENISGAAGATGGSLAGGVLGAKAGVAVGAAIGSVVPVAGTAAGALVGGAVGAVGGAIAGSELGRSAGRFIGRGINWLTGN